MRDPARPAGTFGEHGSGEYAIAFFTAWRIPHAPSAVTRTAPALAEDGPLFDLLFRAVTEVAEEAVVNALLAAEYVGSTDRASGVPLPVSELLACFPRPRSAGRRRGRRW